MTKTQQAIEQGKKEFEDFYWECGKFEGRHLGINEYKSFLSSYTQQLLNAFIADEREWNKNSRVGMVIFTHESGPRSQEYRLALTDHAKHLDELEANLKNT